MSLKTTNHQREKKSSRTSKSRVKSTNHTADFRKRSKTNTARHTKKSTLHTDYNGQKKSTIRFADLARKSEFDTGASNAKDSQLNIQIWIEELEKYFELKDLSTDAQRINEALVQAVFLDRESRDFVLTCANLDTWESFRDHLAKERRSHHPPHPFAVVRELMSMKIGVEEKFMAFICRVDFLRDKLLSALHSFSWLDENDRLDANVVVNMLATVACENACPPTIIPYLSHKEYMRDINHVQVLCSLYDENSRLTPNELEKYMNTVQSCSWVDFVSEICNESQYSSPSASPCDSSQNSSTQLNSPMSCSSSLHRQSSTMPSTPMLSTPVTLLSTPLPPVTPSSKSPSSSEPGTPSLIPLVTASPGQDLSLMPQPGPTHATPEMPVARLDPSPPPPEKTPHTCRRITNPSPPPPPAAEKTSLKCKPLTCKPTTTKPSPPAEKIPLTHKLKTEASPRPSPTTEKSKSSCKPKTEPSTPPPEKISLNHKPTTKASPTIKSSPAVEKTPLKHHHARTLQHMIDLHVHTLLQSHGIHAHTLHHQDHHAHTLQHKEGIHAHTLLQSHGIHAHTLHHPQGPSHHYMAKNESIIHPHITPRQQQQHQHQHHRDTYLKTP
ncbi:hypothetical protein Pmani_032236 [Petrolisthes manimaculis]|uniref:Uncharacterized protein n=1 Tax=Petrolisthes manimaculis TaxID=1843537 RepID=A0AAE1NU12_9EUCA|nr:hypothetical protein Pmani_032236 [Petrolisthes manimaculis]